jgi:hypothetical protein
MHPAPLPARPQQHPVYRPPEATVGIGDDEGHARKTAGRPRKASTCSSRRFRPYSIRNRKSQESAPSMMVRIRCRVMRGLKPRTKAESRLQERQ